MARVRQRYAKTSAQYAADYGVTQRTITNWRKKGWPLDDPAKTNQLIQLNEPGDADQEISEAMSLADARKKKLLLECERLQIKRDTERGELMLIADARDEVVKVSAAFNGAIDMLEGELPGLLEGLTATQIRNKLKPYAKQLRKLLHDPKSKLWRKAS